MATIQIDLTMLPERFDLTYIDEEGKPQRPIAIHRAIYGSLERFIGILIEHFAGAFPLWLAPVQAVVIPIADRHIEAARGARGRPARRAGCGSRSTARRTGCSTRSGRPRSRRCRTWSCSATARSRRGRRRRGPGPGSSNRPRTGTSFADRLAEESRSPVDRVDAVRGPAASARLRRCRDQGRDGRAARLGGPRPGPAAVHRQGVHRSGGGVSDRAARAARRLVDRRSAARDRIPGRRPTSCSGCRSSSMSPGTRSNLYDTIEWWDDANHLVNWFAAHGGVSGCCSGSGGWGRWTRAALAHRLGGHDRGPLGARGVRGVRPELAGGGDGVRRHARRPGAGAGRAARSRPCWSAGSVRRPTRISVDLHGQAVRVVQELQVGRFVAEVPETIWRRGAAVRCG